MLPSAAEAPIAIPLDERVRRLVEPVGARAPLDDVASVGEVESTSIAVCRRLVPAFTTGSGRAETESSASTAEAALELAKAKGSEEGAMMSLLIGVKAESLAAFAIRAG